MNPVLQQYPLSNVLSLKSLFSLLLVFYFAIQPWNHQLADATWLLLSLFSLVYVATYKLKGLDFNTPKELKTIFWLFSLMPLVSIISYIASPLDTLTPKMLEAETRWLLVIPMIIALRELKMGPYWVLTMLIAYTLSTFTSAFIETQYLSNLRIRANGDENAVSYGMFNATIALLLLSFFVSGFIKHKTFKHRLTIIRVAVFIVFTLACLATFLSGSRAATILTPIGVFIIYAINYSKTKAALGIIILLSIGTLLTATQPNSAFVQKLLTAPEKASNYFIKHDRKSRLQSPRLEQWAESWCIYKKHPITGTGPRSFKQAHQEYGDEHHCNAIQELRQGAYQAHSLYFNTLATLGSLGLIALIFIFAQLIKVAFITLKNKDTSKTAILGALLLVSVIISHLINGLTLDLLFRNHIIDKFLIVIALPIILIFYKQTEKDQHPDADKP